MLWISVENMEPLQIEGQTDQVPFGAGVLKAARGELAKAKNGFDDANDRFHGGFAQAIDGLADGGLQLIGHFDAGRGLLGRRFRVVGEAFLPALVMQFAARGKIGFNAALLASGKVIWTEVAVIQGSGGRCPQLWG
jgi:hypothetical protein